MVNVHEQGSAKFDGPMRKVWWRLVPFLFLCYLIAFIDRVNVGFAALTMSADIGLSNAAFGFGAGLFFVAYVLFEIPSNLAMERFGARRWMARIMITWGLVGVGTAFITGPIGFYISRALLGAAEAGFLPGAILYLSQWFPKAHRARVIAWMMMAIPLSSFIGSPLSAALLKLNGVLGIKGWQWIFILESIPAIIVGIAALWMLPDRPATAKWLLPEEKNQVEAALAEEAGTSAPAHHKGLLRMILDRRVLLLALIYSGSSATSNALSLWQPKILKSFGLSNLNTGLLNMIPFGCAALAMIFWAKRADRSGDKARATAIPLLLTSLALFLTLATNSLVVTLCLLTVVLVCNYSIKGPFWSLATEVLPARAAVVGIAAINSIAHLGTGAANWAVGEVREASGSFPVALLPLVALTAVGGITTLLMARRNAAARADPVKV